MLWGVGKDAVLSGLSKYKPVGMRMRIEEHRGGITVLNDAYNANPASTQASLRTLAAVKQRRKWHCWGTCLSWVSSRHSAIESWSRRHWSPVWSFGLCGAALSAAVEFLGVAERVALADSAGNGSVALRAPS